MIKVTVKPYPVLVELNGQTTELSREDAEELCRKLNDALGWHRDEQHLRGGTTT